MDFEAIIGFETHVELKTRTKLFCDCLVKFDAPPNSHICPVCTGQPGALPVLNREAVEYAIRAGLAMNQRLVELNESFSKQGWPALRHGIGIHTGEAIAANIGSPDRLSYLLVGDTVNLASRLQGLTKELETEVIISQATRSRLEEDVLLKALPPAKVRGKTEPVEIYALT